MQTKFRWFANAIGVALLQIVAGCASRNLYAKFEPSQEILRRQWTYSVEPVSSSMGQSGMEYISPKKEGNTLVFGSQRGGVVALYPNLLRERWKILNNVGVVSPISVYEGRVYFTSGKGELVSAFFDNGKIDWTYPLRNPVTSAPVVSGAELFLVTSDDAVLGLEAQTGKWLWHYRRKNTTGPSIHGAAAPLVVGDSVWVGFSDGALVSLSKKEGKVRWEKQLNNNRRFADIDAELFLSGDRVFVSAYDNDLYALDAKTGATLWTLPKAGGAKGMQVDSETLYVPSSTGYVYAIETKTGKVLWKFELDHPVTSGVTILKDKLVIASSSQYLYVLSRTSGQLLDRFDVGHQSGFSGAFIADTTRPWIYGLSRGGNLMAFSLAHEND